jgi:putative holliday junction resolvase
MRALGVDYGRKRIGLALSDPTGLLARPWKTLTLTGFEQQVRGLTREIETLTNESDGLSVVVIGLPRRLSGEHNDLTPVVQAFADRLRQLTGVEVTLQDERLTSREAEDVLARTERDWRKRKPLLDAAAAAIVLQDYLDARPRLSRERLEP